jgi:hypothetical protein
MKRSKPGQTATVPVVPDLVPPLGVVIDGVVYALDGQPPMAVSHGWGDLSWLAWRWY